MLLPWDHRPEGSPSQVPRALRRFADYRQAALQQPRTALKGRRLQPTISFLLSSLVPYVPLNCSAISDRRNYSDSSQVLGFCPAPSYSPIMTFQMSSSDISSSHRGMAVFHGMPSTGRPTPPFLIRQNR